MPDFLENMLGLALLAGQYVLEQWLFIHCCSFGRSGLLDGDI